jgi:hypothetical protein
MLGVLVGAVMLATSVVPGETARAPSDKWVVNFEHSRCIASREYGSADRPVTLMLKAPVQGKVIQLALLRGSRNSVSAHESKGSVGMNGATTSASALIYHSAQAQRLITLFNLPATDVESWGMAGRSAWAPAMAFRRA